MKRDKSATATLNDIEKSALDDIARQEAMTNSETLRWLIRKEAKRRGLWPFASITSAPVSVESKDQPSAPNGGTSPLPSVPIDVPRHGNYRTFPSDRQRELMRFLWTYYEEHGYPPTIREMADAMALSSTSTVRNYLEKLEDLAYVRCWPRRSRGVELLKSPEE